MKFYKRDPDRALAGMAELSFRQRGAYNTLLDLLYSRNGEVPDDDVRVARMMSAHWREWATVKAELIALGKVWVEGGMIRAKRVQETIKEAADFSQEQRKRASSGWDKRRNDNENNEPEMPSGNALTPIDTPTPTPKEEKEKTVKKETPRASRAEFEEFWLVCPRKIGKGAASKAYEKARSLTDQRSLIAGMRAYAASRSGEEARFTVHPSTWLNQQRWTDEISEKPNGSTANVHLAKIAQLIEEEASVSQSAR